jgi:hypothetical protein
MNKKKLKFISPYKLIFKIKKKAFLIKTKTKIELIGFNNSPDNNSNIFLKNGSFIKKINKTRTITIFGRVSGFINYFLKLKKFC